MTRYAILPHERFTIVTRLTPAQVLEALAPLVEPKRSVLRFRRYRGSKEFQGEIGASEFRVRRTINYRNSFLPVIRGKIVVRAGGKRYRAHA